VNSELFLIDVGVKPYVSFADVHSRT